MDNVAFSHIKEIPRISRKPKFHYCTHQRSPPVSILGQPNPVLIPTSHLLEIHPNIIHPSTPRSPQWSPSLRFLQQDPIHPLSSPIRATCPAHLILLIGCRMFLKRDGTRAKTRFCISAKWTRPFKSAGALVQSTTGSRGVRISGSNGINAGYTMFQR